MDPNDIELQSTAKSFAYEKIARDIDKCEDIAELQKISKCYAKLYFKQQETMTMIGLATLRVLGHWSKLNDPTYFTNTSDGPYDRHTYRVRLTNKKASF